MNYYPEPDKELTEEEKLLADVIDVSQRMPCGFQIGMPMHLVCAIEQLDELFTEKKLPYKDELLGELRRWKAHAEQGLVFSAKCDSMMQEVIQLMGSNRKH